MLTVYLGTALRWQHGWQYGAGMALIACLSFGYALQLGRPGSRFARIAWLDAAALVAGLQAATAAVGLTALIASGKVWSTRADWPANLIFLAGGIAIVAASAAAASTHARMRSPPSHVR